MPDVRTLASESFPLAGFLAKNMSGKVKAYLNILNLNEDCNFMDGGYQEAGPQARENDSGVPHHMLNVGEFLIEKPGYAYV